MAFTWRKGLRGAAAAAPLAGAGLGGYLGFGLGGAAGVAGTAATGGAGAPAIPGGAMGGAAVGATTGKLLGNQLGKLLNYLAGPEGYEGEEAQNKGEEAQNTGGMTNQQVQQLLQDFRAQQEQYQPTDFGGIQANVERQYREETLPSIMERFRSPGGAQSGPLQRAIGQAGVGLQERLAALRSQHEMQQQQGRMTQQGINLQGLGQMAGFMTGQGQLGLGYGQLGLGREQMQQQLIQQQMQNMMMPYGQYQQGQQQNQQQMNFLNQLLANQALGRGVENIGMPETQGILAGGAKLAANLTGAALGNRGTV